MSIMAGIFSRNPSVPIPKSTCESIMRLISRKKEEEIQKYEDPSFFVAKVDIGAYRYPAFRLDSDRSFSALTGEPLLSVDENEAKRNRERDLEILHEGWKKGNWDVLRGVNGLFCATHYDPKSHRLVLLCDKHGLRPFYYWENERCVIFSTALRILEELKEVPKKLDIASILQMQTLKFSLADRTAYVGIKRLQAGEILSFSSGKKEVARYWRWDEVPCSKQSEQEQLEDLYHRFRAAVKRRLRNDRVTVCALSGGLDSRCVVGVLKDLGATVYTFNFAPPNTQDSVLAERFAQKIGCIHKEISLDTQVDDLFALGRRKAWEDFISSSASQIDKPPIMWTGDGGSAGLGHLYTSKPVIDFMRNKELDKAIDLYLRRMSFSVGGRFLKPKVIESYSNVLHAGIREILDGLNCEDPARNFFLFVMLYEQRGIFTDYYEDIDIYRLDLHIPFLDSNFFEAIVASPIDLCLKHHLYHKWLRLFPEPVYSVPWQSYPGHEPCPHPIPEDLKWQWDGVYKIPEREAWRKQNRLKKARQIMKRENFPQVLARKHYFRLAVLLYRLGIRDYSWLIDKMEYISKYWSRCNGEYESTT